MFDKKPKKNKKKKCVSYVVSDDDSYERIVKKIVSINYL